MSFSGFERAQAEYERRRAMSPEDEDEARESHRARREYEAERADDLRDRQKDRRAEQRYEMEQEQPEGYHDEPEAGPIVLDGLLIDDEVA